MKGGVGSAPLTSVLQRHAYCMNAEPGCLLQQSCLAIPAGAVLTLHVQCALTDKLTRGWWCVCIRSYTSFSGCGGASTGELATVEFKSTSAQKQTVCLDSLRLFSSSGSS